MSSTLAQPKVLLVFCLATQACGGDDGVGTTSPSGPIAGNPSAPVAGAVPPPEFDDGKSTYRRDHPDLPGIGISVDTVLLAFRLETTIGQANQVLAAEDATIAGGVTGTPGVASGIWILRLPTTTHAALASALVRLEKEPEVEVVVPDTVLDPLAVPGPNAGDPASWAWDLTPTGPNWGHERVRMPEVWNLNDGVERDGGGHPVWVFDAGFDTSHEDLANAVALGGVWPHSHGTHVAGTIGATFDDGYGIDGLDPFVKMGLKQTLTVGSNVEALEDAVKELATIGTVPIVNMSIGYNWRDLGINPSTHGAAKNIVQKGALLFQKTMKALDAKGALPLVVAAAGNDSGGEFGDIHTRYSSPMNAAALELGVANVISVEATTNAPVLRRKTSSTGGHVSAPGEAIWSASVGPEGGVPDYQPGIPPYFEAKSGTSMAAPHVTGIASYLLAFDPLYSRPTLTENPIRELLVKYATPVPNGAPGVDAFATIVAANPARAFRYLADIDDGTPDGNDRTTTADVRGDGKVDMRDFRRFRDWLSQIEGTGHLDGPVDHSKFDLNRDGLLEGFEKENVYPRGDFNGDGVLSRSKKSFVPALGEATDLDILLDRFQDDDYSAAALAGLLDSGDVAIDTSSCLARPGVGSVRVRVSNVEPEETVEQRLVDSAEPSQVLTVPAPMLANLELVALDSTGVEGSRSERPLEEILVGSDMGWNADCVVLTGLSPGSGQAGDELTLEGGGFALELADVHVVFESPATGEKLEAAISGATLVGSEVTAIKVQVPNGVSAAPSWKVYVEQPLMRSNELDFSVSKPCITDLHALGGPGQWSNALAVNESGDVLWNQFDGYPVTGFARIAGTLYQLPCHGQDLNDAGLVVDNVPGAYWEPSNPSVCTALPLGDKTSAVVMAVNASGQIVHGDGYYWPSVAAGGVVTLQTFQATQNPNQPAVPVDINDSAQIIGVAPTDGQGNHVALWSNGGAPLDLGSAGPGGFYPTAISNAGHLVGRKQGGPGVPSVAAQLVNGTIVVLGKIDLGPNTLSLANDVNASGESVGRSWANGGADERGMIWLPQPAYGTQVQGLFSLSDFLNDATWQVLSGSSINDKGQVAGQAMHLGIKKGVLIDLPSCTPTVPPTPH